ncbi:hypothetical protein, partial [Methanobrevibacter sp. UBA188]|uniref:hypothetical protein n=1 Tax=Methanobrevibacter sp. UBA188 TaxID=1915473 RepID=UPI0025F02843
FHRLLMFLHLDINLLMCLIIWLSWSTSKNSFCLSLVTSHPFLLELISHPMYSSVNGSCSGTSVSMLNAA